MSSSEALREMARRVAEQRAIRGELQKGYGPLYARINELEHARHRAWRRWKVTSEVLGRAYQLGVINGYGYQGNSSCRMCVSMVLWRGRRHYILGWTRDRWVCLLKYGHRQRLIPDANLCAVCCPCLGCGSTDPGHESYACEIAADRVRTAEVTS